MIQFNLTKGQRAIQKMARRFTADALTRNATRWNEHHFVRCDTTREAEAVAA